MKKVTPPVSNALERYQQKRDFSVTPEPADGGASGGEHPHYVIQKHWASRLHYDLRLEIDGTMKSWAVPKGPSLDPSDKRMAVQVEDHPLSYNTFEGQIPAKQYGAGRVIVWDSGYWTPIGDAAAGYRQGKLKFKLFGHKLNGLWTLVRMHGKANEKQPSWLLIKEKDGDARPARDFSVVDALPDSVHSSRPIIAPHPAAGKSISSLPTSAAKAKVPLPETLAPQLATLVDAPPAHAQEWVWELKFDGYRLLARVHNKTVRLFTRNGNDWTDRMHGLANVLRQLPLGSGWLDGEVVMLDSDGKPDFQALQDAFGSGSADDLIYYVFDLPYADGHDLRSLPLDERRDKLRAQLATMQSDRVRFSESFSVNPADLVSSACSMGFEGVVGKRRLSPYASQRNADWVKLKCGQRQEFVVCGFTDPQGSRTGFGALMLGVHEDDGELRFAGSVGTGFNERSLDALHKRLMALETSKTPFLKQIATAKKVHWVKPELLIEASFAEWTAQGRIRHGVFHGVRTDKPARAIMQERPQSPPGAGASRKGRMAAPLAADKQSSRLGSQQISHPDRVIDKKSGTTKLDVVRYYDRVAPLMMEHLKDRPVSLVRAPEGVGGELFFQKHLDRGSMDGIVLLNPDLDVGHAPLLAVANTEGLLSASQQNVLEFHTWNSRKDRIERPDRMTFDLDPGEGVAWEAVLESAQLVQVLLGELNLPAFLKTSGGKGLHVVVPLKRLHSWDAVKGFSQAVVQHLSQTIPARFVAKSGPRNRVGKVFVDYLRNGRGATTVSAWSARARPGMGISVPVAWSELALLTSGAHWTVSTVDERLRAGNTPWDGYHKAAVSLSSAMKLLGFNSTK